MIRNLNLDQAPATSGSVRDIQPVGALTRRQLLQAGSLTALGFASGLGPCWAATVEGAPGERFLGLVNFDDETVAPAGTLIGTELDGRLYTDLSRVSANRLITPTSEFYIRSAASRLLPNAGGWAISIAGNGEKPGVVDIRTLRGMSRPMGTHLMECAGNVRLTRFGLISVADWTGVGLEEVLDRAGTKVSATSWIEVSGFDEYAGQSATSIPGASWIFPMAALRDSRAFLATGMNGQSLTRDHGLPVRLVVPGWYGCCSIKWVNRIAVVSEDVEAASQMREYAVRTLQGKVPQLARDFAPATVDTAAVPVRLEKWKAGNRLSYRVVGLLWGGAEPIRRLEIRFNPDEEFVPVRGLRQFKTDPWTIWTHTWTPQAPGRYTIRLNVAGPAVRARKLQLGLYDRSVDVSEI